MISSSVSVIARFAAWSALPDFITRNILQIIHQSVFPLLKLQAPPPRTPAYARNYRATFAVVVLGYLIYNLVEASRGMPANFYEILGVEPSADEGKLKLAFRQFAKKYHPDRVGPEGELLFIEVRDAYEALKSPVRRFAYDRYAW
jgi:DnaJ-domain-containing protein 1